MTTFVSPPPNLVGTSPPPGLQPPSVLLEGASGAGKTSSIITLLLAGIEVFVIGTEPGFIDSLLDRARELKAPIDKLHWMSILPATEGWEALDEMVNKIGSLDFEGVSRLKGVGKDKTRVPAQRLVKALQDFRCERDGKSYGSFTQWGDDRALVIDSLSGVSTIAWYLTVGYKPTGAPGEWNIAMNFIENLLMKINSDRRCYFVLTAHIEKEMDEISGVTRIMTSTLGRKLAPKIPRFFGEVVYAQRMTSDPKFRWSTIDNQADLKNRILPVSNMLLPSFIPIVTGHRERVKLAKLNPAA
jgi:AAA domain